MNVIESRLKGLFVVELDVYGDERGNFREAWQTAKMEAAGLPHFVPVQQSVAESGKGTLRGIHAEPWDKYIHLAYGTATAVLVDLRVESDTFGQYEMINLDSGKAVFVPQGFGNSYQVTSDWAVYSYLVTAHWSPDVKYPAIAFDDCDLGIPWPIGTEGQIISEKDRHNPTLKELYPHKFSL